MPGAGLLMGTVKPSKAVTALTLYPIATTTGTQRKLNTSAPSGATEAFGRTSNSANVYSQWRSTVHTLTSGASQPAPNGKGSEWFVTTLVGNHFVAGTWTVKLKVKGSRPRSGTLIVRFYRRNGTTYNLIGTMSGTVAVTATSTVFTLTGTFSASATFATGTKLYMDCTHHVTAAGTTTTITLAIGATSSIVTPGYAA